MCSSCNNKHKRVSQFQQHHVCKMADHNLCDEHKQNVTHLCVKCAKRLCMKCMLINHLEHEHYFKEFSEGVSVLKEEFKSMKTNIDDNLSELLHEKKLLQANVSITKQIKVNLENALVFHSKKSKIEAIHSNHEGYPAIFDEISMSEETCRKTLNELELVINNKEGDICRQYIPLNDQAKQALENMFHLHLTLSMM